MSRRRSRILEIVNIEGTVLVSELSKRLAVSPATVRRDLAKLDRDGLIKRVHGGAMARENGESELSVLSRHRDHVTEKQKIGKAAAGLISNGETVFIGSGSTTIEVTRALRERRDISDLTVITNSLPVVNALIDERRFTVIVIGGYLRHGEQSVIGWIAEQTLNELRADKVIIGIAGLDEENGLLSTYVPEVLTDRAILRIGSEITVVADHSKFQRDGTVRLAPVTAIDTIVTDDLVPDRVLNGFREKGIRVIAAS